MASIKDASYNYTHIETKWEDEKIIKKKGINAYENQCFNQEYKIV